MYQRIDQADAERLAAEIITPEVVAEAVPSPDYVRLLGGWGWISRKDGVFRCDMPKQEVKQPVEDFLEPLEWAWTRSTYRARMLAKEYAEGVADEGSGNGGDDCLGQVDVGP